MKREILPWALKHHECLSLKPPKHHSALVVLLGMVPMESHFILAETVVKRT